MLKNIRAVLLLAVLMCLFTPVHGNCEGPENETLNIDLVAAGAASWMNVKMDAPIKEQLRLAAVAQHCNVEHDAGGPFPVNEILVRKTVDTYLNYMTSLTGVPVDVSEKEYPYLRSAVLLMFYSYVDGVEEELKHQLQNNEVDEVAFCTDFRKQSGPNDQEVSLITSSGH